METTQSDLTAYFKNIIERFLERGHDPVDFSYFLPSEVVKHGDELRKQNPKLLSVLDGDLPEICANFDLDEDPEEFIEAVRKEYERAFPA